MKPLLRLALFTLALLAAGCASNRSVLLEGTNIFDFHVQKYFAQCVQIPAAAPADCDAYHKELLKAQADLLALTDAMILGGPSPLQREAVEANTKALKARGR